MNKKPIIVFDVDGTLVDSAPDLLDSANYSLQAEGLKTLLPEDLIHLVSYGGRVMFERALTGQGVDPQPQRIDRLLEIFWQHYGENIPGKSRYFDGVPETLDALQQSGYMLAICTNKYESMAKALIQALGGADRFAAICGGDTFAWRKPDPRHLFSTIEKAGGNPQQAIMVGDSANDIEAAKAASIPVIAVDFGYTDIPVRKFNPTKVISNFAEITPQLVAELMRMPIN